MDSTVDIQKSSSSQALDVGIHVTRALVSSEGVSICRLTSGQYAISVHRADQRSIVELTRGDLLKLADDIRAYVS